MITILGQTATGKTTLAVALADRINGDVISADSRQVYRGMDIGTGKDLKEYKIKNKEIPHQLIDIVDAGKEYIVYQFQKDFYKIYKEVELRGNIPILCGGSGLYLEAVLKGYNLNSVPFNYELRKELEAKSDIELIDMLAGLHNLHNNTDTSSRERLIKAIEIAFINKMSPSLHDPIKSIIFGIVFDRDTIRKRITERLKQRLSEGLIDEAGKLIKNGLTLEKLKYYGLEYKFLALYIEGVINYEEMFNQLNIAIHQFSKRQMTWFRKMEREGFKINWLDGNLPMDEKIKLILEKIKQIIPKSSFL